MVHKGQTGGVGINGVNLVAGTTGQHAHEGNMLVGVVEQTARHGGNANRYEREY
jgi:hypothetical protein